MKQKFNPGTQKYEPELPLKKGKTKVHMSFKDKLIGAGVLIFLITIIYLAKKFII